MADYYSIIACAVSRLPSKADEARHAISEEARKALHERLGNDPQISHDELVNEHYRLEAAIYEVEDDLLLSDMRRFVSEEAALSSPCFGFVSRTFFFPVVGRTVGASIQMFVLKSQVFTDQT